MPTEGMDPDLAHLQDRPMAAAHSRPCCWGGNKTNDSELDEVQVQRVDDVDLDPMGESKYVRVKVLRLRS
jgi:hypothetical protein